MVSSSGRFGVRVRVRGGGLWFGRAALALGLGGVLALGGAPPAHAAPVKPDKPAAAAPEAKEKATPKPKKARRADQRTKGTAKTDAVKKDAVKKDAVKKDESSKDAVKKDESPKDAVKKDESPKDAVKDGAASKGGRKKKKTVAARTDASRRRNGKARKERKARKDPPKPCLGPAAQIDRGGLEAERIILVDCKGKPREEAQKQLSLLARPWGAPRPSALADAPPAGPKAPPLTRSLRAGEVAPSVRLVDPGLLVRIDALARRYPDKPISLVSGYRPQSRGSLHQTARALDLRIAGVPNHELVAACRALSDTGCGYYPNSSFIHVDVRSPGTGSVSWIDASGPGEAPRYVTAWPPPAEKPEEAPAQKAAEAQAQKAAEAQAEKGDAKAAKAPAKEAPPTQDEAKQDEAKVEQHEPAAPGGEPVTASEAASEGGG